MDREHVMSEFKQEIATTLQDYRNHITSHILERSEQLEFWVKAAMNELGTKMEIQEKEYVSFLYISTLKMDLIQRNYRFLIQAMNIRWYFDEEPLEVYFSARDLFEPLEQLWDKLNQKSRDCQGLVNKYDVQHIIFDELAFIDALISRILRYRLRNWEEKGIFSNVTRSPYWFLKWGEYRDQSEFIIHTDREEKDGSVWRGELKKALHKPETMVFSYWYRGEYEDSSMSELDMRFMVFEDSKLRRMEFRRCNLEGIRLSNCTLTDCSFEDCNLYGADFTKCTFERVSFHNADLAEALFPAFSVPFLHLTPEQLQTIQLAKEESE